MKRAFSACVLLAMAAGSAAFGQDVSGTIGGSILDASNSAVPNAKITVTDTNRNQVVRTVTTASGGTYTVPLLPVGIYSLKVEAKGFKIEERNQVVLNVNDDLKINMTLQVGSASEVVEVTADAAAVELGSPAVANTIEGTQIRELALGTRNYESLVALMPGVASNAVDDLYVGNSLPSGAASTVPFSINGSATRPTTGRWMAPTTWTAAATRPSRPSPAWTRSRSSKWSAADYTADTGRAGGAQINVVTKSGASQFHGGAYEFFRNDALNANLWSNNANSVNLVNGAAKITPVRWNDYGFTIGGPIYIPGKYQQGQEQDLLLLLPGVA